MDMQTSLGWFNAPGNGCIGFFKNSVKDHGLEMKISVCVKDNMSWSINCNGWAIQATSYHPSVVKLPNCIKSCK